MSKEKTYDLTGRDLTQGCDDNRRKKHRITERKANNADASIQVYDAVQLSHPTLFKNVDQAQLILDQEEKMK